jgi:hypothetical protein
MECHCLDVMQVTRAAASQAPLVITGEQGLDTLGLAAYVHTLASKQQVSSCRNSIAQLLVVLVCGSTFIWCSRQPGWPAREQVSTLGLASKVHALASQQQVSRSATAACGAPLCSGNSMWCSAGAD